MENTQEDVKLPEVELMKENLRVKKTTYIKEQMERQRAAEDARLKQLLQEQEIIDSLRKSTDDSMWQTEETRKYSREFQEHLNMQIYKAHGITGDALTGMREYRNALHRGAAAVLFFLSLMLTVLCGVLHGFGSKVCLLMFAYTAVEGALAGKRQKPVLSAICKVLYILIFPSMMVMFVCYELGYNAYEIFLPYAVILGGFVTVLGTISYFLHDPYRLEKKRIQDARSQIRDIEKAAGKEIRKEQKVRKKEEKKAQKPLKNEFFAWLKKRDEQPGEVETERIDSEETRQLEEQEQQEVEQKEILQGEI